MAIKFLSGLNLSDVTAGSILKLDSNGKIVAAVDGTDYNTGSADSWSDVGVNIYRNSDVRIGTYQSGVAPSARLHVFDYQTTDPKLLIEDGNTGDASMQFKISTQQYTMGIDNSSSDKFVLAASSALGTTNAIEVSTSGTTTFKSTAYFQGDAYFDGDGQTFYFTADNTDRTTIRWQIDGGNKYVISTVGANSLYWGRESGNTSGHIELDTPIRITGSLTVNTDSYADTITTGHSGTLNLIDTKTLILDDSFGTSDGRVFGVLQPASFKPSDITLGDSAYSSAATGSYVTNNYPNVKGESDATGITDGATFTFAEALDQAETLGGRLPTLEEIMSGVGRGSGQGYDNEYIWTQTKAGHGRYWVARGSAVTTNDAIVVDINASTPPEYRMRIFYDISKDNMPVYYDNSSNIRATSIKAENSDGIALRALDGDIGITVTDDGNVKFNQYTAGLLKTDSVGNISLDTNTYLTSVSVDWSDIASINGTININSTTQIGEGDTETLVSFQNSGTERGSFQVDSSTNSYFVATGFKTSTASTGFLKADGTVDTNTYSTATGVANNADVTPSWVPATDPAYATTDYVDTELTGVASESWANTNLVNVTGDTMTGALTITDSGTGLHVDSAGHASLRMDRGSTSFDNNLLYYTAGALKWRIWMDGSDDYLYIRDEANSNNMVTFEKGGNVGIGTTNPSDKLHVIGNATFHSGSNLGTLSVGRSSSQNIKIYVDDTNNTITAYQDSDGNSAHIFALDRQFDGTGANNFFIRKGGSNQLGLDTSGNLRLYSYGAGLLKTDANGNVSLDTNTYSTATGVADNADAYGSWTVSDGTNTENVTSGTTVAWRGSGATSVSYDASTNQFNISSTNTQYSNATTSVSGLMSSTDKTKLDGIASGAEVNVQSDWNATSGDAYIQNKPTLGTAAASAATDFVAVSGDTMTGGLVAGGGISGLTLTNGISGTNFNITGVNQLEIADPGEGIVFKSGSSGDMTLAIVDDSSDNILRFSGTNATFDVAGALTSTNLTIADAIYHEGDTNTSISFGTDTINFNTGGGVRAIINDSGAKFNNNVIVGGGSTFSLGEAGEEDDNGRTVLIEGVANGGNGEGSGRIFFSENNNTATNLYGLSLYYEGDGNAQLPSGFQPNTGNATWSLRTHNNNSNGVPVIRGSRTDQNVTFGGNLYVPNVIYHAGDTNTYMQFHAGDQWRVVTGGTERLEVNNSYTSVRGSDLYAEYKSHAGDQNWRTRTYVRSVGVEGGSIADKWVHLTTVDIDAAYDKAALKFKIHGFDDVSCGTENIDVLYENGGSSQETHRLDWYSTDGTASLFKAVKSTHSGSNLAHSYELWVQMAGDWRDTFTVEVETWTDEAGFINYSEAVGQVTAPSGDANDQSKTSREWYTKNTTIYADGTALQTQSQADSRYLQLTGGTVSGAVTLGAQLTLSSFATGVLRVDSGSVSVDSNNYLTSMPANSTVTSVTFGGVKVEEASDRPGLLEINRDGSDSWSGIMTKFSGTAEWALMGDENEFGLFDDQNNQWAWRYVENSDLVLYNGGVVKAATKSDGFQVKNTLELGAYATTDQGVLKLAGSTADRQSILKTTNGNLHVDSHAGYGIYLNWYGGNGGVFFGNGSGASGASVSSGGVYTATGGNSTNWNTAYGWGNHASAGYLTSYTETDTLASVTGRGASTTTALSIRGLTARNILPEADRTYNLGGEETRWRIVYCETLDSAGQHESNLQDEEMPISQYATGTVLSWKGGKNRPCTQHADHMRMGIAVEGQDSPLIQGAEPVLVTGVVEEGDYLVTSEKEGHAVAVPRNIVKEQMLFDCVIGKALESGDGDSHLIKTWINI